MRRSSSFVEVPDSLDARVSVWAEPLAVALHAISRADIIADERVIIVGFGATGAQMLQVLITSRCQPMWLNPQPPRRGLAQRLGAKNDGHKIPIGLVADVIFERSGTTEGFVTGVGAIRARSRMVMAVSRPNHSGSAHSMW